MKAPVHGELGAVEAFGPAAHPAAEVLLAFDDVDRDAPFGQSRCGGQARDSGAHDDGPRLR